MPASSPTQTELDVLVTAILAEVNAALPTAGTGGDITSVTDGSIAGTGAFDVLMKAGLLHIQQEFDESRIRGTDYAQTYLGMFQACLQTAAQLTSSWDTAALEREKVELQRVQLQLEKSKVLATLMQAYSQTDLTLAQTNLYNQKTVTELSEVTTTPPAGIAGGADLSTIIPYAPTKIAGAKGANRDVTLEQRAGYQRKAQNDLIKVATGHVDMLVSSGAATNVGDYTTSLLALLQKGGDTAGNAFEDASLLAKAVQDVSTLSPKDADSMD